MEKKSTEPEILQTELDRYKSGFDIVEWAARNKVYRELMVMCYIEEVKSGRMVRIENLDFETKNEIWNETKKYSALLDKRGCVQLSKIVYVIMKKLS